MDTFEGDQLAEVGITKPTDKLRCKKCEHDVWPHRAHRFAHHLHHVAIVGNRSGRDAVSQAGKQKQEEQDIKDKQDKSFWRGWIRWYKWFLGKLLSHKKRSLAIILICIIMATVGVLKITKFQLFPEFDAQQVYMNGKIDINNDLSETEVYVAQIEEALLEILDRQEMDSVTSVIGFKFNKDQSFEMGENLFQIFINLHEKAPKNFFDRYINPVFSLEYDDSDMIRARLSQDIAKEIQERIVEKFKKQEVHGKKLYEEFNV